MTEESKKKHDKLQELSIAVFKNTEAGRMLLEELKSRFVNVPLWGPGMPEGHEVYFREGGRHLVMYLDNLINMKH
jgi:hypothetical protein